MGTHRLLHRTVEQSYLARDGKRNGGGQCFDDLCLTQHTHINGTRNLGSLQECRAHIALDRELLGTAHVDIDGRNILFSIAQRPYSSFTQSWRLGRRALAWERPAGERGDPFRPPSSGTRGSSCCRNIRWFPKQLHRRRREVRTVHFPLARHQSHRNDLFREHGVAAVFAAQHAKRITILPICEHTPALEIYPTIRTMGASMSVFTYKRFTTSFIAKDTEPR